MSNSRGNEYFNCSEEHEFQYVSGLYNEKKEVYNYLKDACSSNEIKYSTHQEVYFLLEIEGFTRK